MWVNKKKLPLQNVELLRRVCVGLGVGVGAGKRVVAGENVCSNVGEEVGRIQKYIYT